MKNPVSLIISTVVIIALLFSAAYYFSTKEETQMPIVETPDNNQFSDDIHADRSITARHRFSGGMHTIVGEIGLPTPCHLLQHETVIRESFPEQVTIEFTATAKDVELCAQVITPQRFKVVFDASEKALITATYNGVPAILNLIQVDEGENLDDFEVFIKG